jgi:hypothetical protein
MYTHTYTYIHTYVHTFDTYIPTGRQCAATNVNEPAISNSISRETPTAPATQLRQPKRQYQQHGGHAEQPQTSVASRSRQHDYHASGACWRQPLGVRTLRYVAGTFGGHMLKVSCRRAASNECVSGGGSGGGVINLHTYIHTYIHHASQMAGSGSNQVAVAQRPQQGDASGRQTAAVELTIPTPEGLVECYILRARNIPKSEAGGGLFRGEVKVSFGLPRISLLFAFRWSIIPKKRVVISGFYRSQVEAIVFAR